MKPLSKALWASTVALGHALTAYRHLSRVKSATVSPDGNLGGRGYVMRLADMRQKLYEASEALSAISDTIYDELQAPHWKPKLAQLDESDKDDVVRFVEEAEEVMENPEGEAEETIEKIEDKKTGPSSGLPDDGGPQEEGDVQADPDQPRKMQASQRPFGMTDRQWVHEFYGNPEKYPNHPYHGNPEGFRHIFVSKPEDMLLQQANSSIPVNELGGPRVDHLGPAEGQGAYGDYNRDDFNPNDPWNADGAGQSRRDEFGEDYDYPSEWENDLSKAGLSSVPDARTDDTPTDAWDFGIGYGARGDGAGDYGNPSGEGNGTKGVEGPASGLPGSPSQSSGDTTRVIIDDRLNTRQAAAYDVLYGKLPQDVLRPVSRSDYYSGPKDNMVSVGTSELPSQENVPGRSDLSLVDTLYVQEDMGTGYERYDYTTHTLREPSGDHPGQDHQEPFAPDGEATR